jgi:UDP-N-acetylglucosamine acyltransferase
MSITIDPRAIVHPNAQIGDNVIVGPFSIIEDNVTVGAGTHIGAHAILAGGTRVGQECRIHHGAVLGTVPQDLKFRGEPTLLEVGDHTTLREYVTLNRGTAERGKTAVGHHCFIMAYVHVAHDCSVGNHVILANSVNMAGHVSIEDHVVIGGIVPIHQFVRIGAHAMIGGGFRVSKDVPPYVLAGHEPLAYQGLNIVGLKRRNFSPAVLSGIEKAYQLIYQSEFNVSQALEKIKNEIPMTDEVRHIVDFVERSKRGIIWSRK